MDVKVREATTKDAPKISPILRESILENDKKDFWVKAGGLDAYTIKLLKYAYKRSDKVYVAEVDGELVGYVFFNLDKSIKGIKKGYVFNLAVKREYRRKGIGKLLMSRVMEYFQQQRVVAVDLLVRIDKHYVQNLYKRMGFDITFLKMTKNMY